MRPEGAREVPVASPLTGIFDEAARLNHSDQGRKGNVFHLARGCEVIATGDLHGHRQNLARIAAWADLPRHESRRLILQEIVHAPPDARTGLDRSVDVLLRAARLKLAHPEQVVFLLGNHDIAEAMGNDITKAGRGVCKSFAEGVRHAVGDEAAGEVLEAIHRFLLSAPIAARTPGGTLICHTLPTPQRMELAGWDIPDEPYSNEDLGRGGRAYEWTWGRKQTPEQVDRLAERMGVSFFVLAHQHIDTPFEFICPRAVILTAEHDRGSVLPFASGATLTEQSVRQALCPIAALGGRG